MHVRFYNHSTRPVDLLILPVFEDMTLSGTASDHDTALGGRLAKALENKKAFSGKSGQTLSIETPDYERARRVLLLGLGEVDSLKLDEAAALGAKIITESRKGDDKVALDFSGLHIPEDVNAAALIAKTADMAVLRGYKFTKYKTKKADTDTDIASLFIICGDLSNAAEKAYKPLEAVTKGVYFARDLVSEPPNILNPVTYVKRIKEELKSPNIKITVLDDKKMDRMGMGAIVAVGKGSHTPSRMVIMEYDGRPKSARKAKKAPSFAVIGKGVTFDTGGVSIKPGAGMEDMKFDMAGSAAVVGLIKALDERQAKCHVVGAVGLAENQLSERAYRPADVLTSYSGQTIEVINTDAEGRLVLADTLTYIQKTYNVKTVVDLATLTGAMMMALGHEYCGVFSPSEELSGDLKAAGDATEEHLWPMPLHKNYDKQLDSPIADMRNLATGRFAGASTAAAFLNRFIEKGVDWAHLDIAGVAWKNTDQPLSPKGATGFGVRLLNKYIEDHCEA